MCFFSRGQLGLGDSATHTQPQLIEHLGGLDVTSLCAGGWHSLAVTSANANRNLLNTLALIRIGFRICVGLERQRSAWSRREDSNELSRAATS